ncbi:hypothetical protein WIS52_13375 [Pseudonocardia nematodicida]|uniref:Bacteriocin biosynthesis cyclodehydratase domain-containing protein n=1 Tax=Pseudonocardia nematodicida TaxID=1206997 RepID=A0ABV1KC66_9PSEU
MTGLPARLGAPPHVPLVRTGPGAFRVGTDPRRGRLVDDLSPAAVAALDRIAGGPCAVADVLAGAPPGPPRDAVSALLGVLLREGLLVDADRADRVRRARSSALVRVHGEGELAVAVADGLARAGLGGPDARVTSGTVREPDGLARPRTVTGPAGRRAPDLIVLAGSGPHGPVPAGPVEQLLVTLRDGRGLVGPLVLPGRGPCRGCAAPATALPGPATADPHVITATGALAVAQVLAALDGPARGGPPPASFAAELELDPHAGTITVRDVRSRPGCPCARVPFPVPQQRLALTRRARGPSPGGQSGA